MSRSRRNFGFPRWGGYGREKEAATVRLCDYAGCSERGDYPAPKAPHSLERWYFCQAHAQEYNRNWNFFEGMSDQDAARHASDSSDAYAASRDYGWGGATDHNGFSGKEVAALTVLELDTNALQEDIKRQYRRLAKRYHPDANRNDPEAARRFHEIQSAYDVLSAKPFL